MAHGGNVDFSSETENEEFGMGACSGISTNVQKLTRSTNSNEITRSIRIAKVRIPKFRIQNQKFQNLEFRNFKIHNKII